MHTVELIISVLLVMYVSSPLIRMDVKLRLIYLAILFYTGFFGLISGEDLRIVGLVNKDNIAAILLLASFFIVLTDSRALALVRSKTQSSEHKTLFIYMWLFVMVSVLSYVMTIFDGYGVVDSFKTAFGFIQYFLLIVLYILFLSIDEDRFHWFIGILAKMVFLNMAIYVLNSFGISLLGAENYQGINDGLIRNFKGFPLLLPFFFTIAYVSFRNKATVWNSSYVFLAILTIIFSFTRSWIVGLVLIVFFVELFALKTLSTKSIVQGAVSVFLVVMALWLFFPTQLAMLAERFNPALSAAGLEEIENVNIRWIIVQERLELLYEYPFFGVGFINTFDPNSEYVFTFGDGVITGDVFWANLFITTGLTGTVIFLLFLIKAFKLLLKRLNDPIVLSALGMMLYLITTSFFNGFGLFNDAYAFIVILSFGLVARCYRATNSGDPA